MNTKQKVTEAITALNMMDHNGDAEIEHGRADAMLLGVLKSLGHDELVTAYENAKKRVGFWYA